MNSFGNDVIVLASASVDLQAAIIDGVSIHELYEKAMNEFQRLGFIDAIRLFSRPEVYFSKESDQRTYSWFSWSKNVARPLSQLGMREREALGRRFVEQLEELRGAADQSPFIKRFLEGALVLAGENAIIEIEMRPVLVDWGLAPKRAVASEVSFEIHVEATIGPFLPTGLMVKRRDFERQPFGMDAGRDQGAQRQMRSEELGNEGTSIDLTVRVGGDNSECTPAWKWPLAILGFVSSLLGYAAWPGNLLYPGEGAPIGIAEQDALEALRSRAAQLQVALANPDACSVDPSLRRQPLSQPPLTPGVLPGALPGPAAGAAVLPGGNAKSEQPGSANGQAAEGPAQGSQTPGAGPMTLLQLMDQATVLVIAPNGGETQMGSGFFVDKRHVLTNFHVIKGADAGKMIIVNKKIGLKKVTVVASTQTASIGNEDFALLALDENADVLPLGLSEHLERLDPIIAAGYPAFAIDSDEAFRKAANGDVEALRNIQMVVTQGNVTTFTTFGTAQRIIAHSAQTSPGNSGGPLIDECGQAVGVNTFVRSGTEMAIHLNYALSAQSASEFLAANGVQPAMSTAACRQTTNAGSPAPQSP